MAFRPWRLGMKILVHRAQHGVTGEHGWMIRGRNLRMWFPDHEQALEAAQVEAVHRAVLKRRAWIFGRSA